MNNTVYNTPPPQGSFMYIPKGKANCQANEIIDVDGETFRNPIGEGWTATPLETPVILETIFGTIEVRNLPSIDDVQSPQLPLSGGAFAQEGFAHSMQTLH